MPTTALIGLVGKAHPTECVWCAVVLKHPEVSFLREFFEVRGLNILPPFAIADNAMAPLKLSLNTGLDRTQQQFSYLRERYSEIKANA